MSTEDKFRAAVNVIRSLPKNGSYQPSYGVMLKFYAYFKQGTEGACTEPQPGFWEVVKKKKWEAWMRLGNMSRNEAMESYVEELKKIIETMSYTDNVANFLESLGSFYESVPQEDLQLLVGDLIEKVNSRENSPKRAEPDAAKLNGVVTNGRPLVADTDSDADDEEEFIDSVEMDPDSQIDSPHSRPLVNGSLQNGTLHNGSNGTSQNSSGGEEINGEDARHGRIRTRARDRGPAVVKASLNGHAVPIPEDASCLAAQISLTSYAPKHTDTTKLTNWGHMNGDAGSSKDVTDQLRATVKQLQRDLERVTTRVRSLEVATQPRESVNSANQKSIGPSWWPVPELSPRTAAFVVLWPLVVHGAAVWWRYRRNRRNP